MHTKQTGRQVCVFPSASVGGMTEQARKTFDMGIQYHHFKVDGLSYIFITGTSILEKSIVMFYSQVPILWNLSTPLLLAPVEATARGPALLNRLKSWIYCSQQASVMSDPS